MSIYSAFAHISRSLIRSLAALCSIILPFLHISSGKSETQTPPNFIIILFDDLGYGDVGFNGSDIATPYLDRIAKNARVFDQFYTFPWCAATRAAVETGLNPATFGMRSLEHNFATAAALPANVPTLAERLKELGYRTAFLGKWHLSKTLAAGPRSRGYDTAFGYIGGQIDHIRHDNHFGENVLFEEDRPVRADGHMTDLIGGRALEALRRADGPFFLNIAFSVPHYPVQALERFERSNAHIGHAERRSYAGMVTHADAVVGALFAMLEARELLGSTYVFVFSDNGGQERWSNPNYYAGRFPGSDILGSNGPLRGFKSSLYEGGIRVPFLLFDPTAGAGRREAGFASVLDISETVLRLAGHPAAGHGPGRDLLAEPAEGRPIEFFWQTNSESIPFGGGRQEAIRVGDYKLVRSQQRFAWLPHRIRWPFSKFELFDLREDPGEQRDLAPQRPDLVRQLSDKLNGHMTGAEKTFASWRDPAQ